MTDWSRRICADADPERHGYTNRPTVPPTRTVIRTFPPSSIARTEQFAVPTALTVPRHTSCQIEAKRSQGGVPPVVPMTAATRTLHLESNAADDRDVYRFETADGVVSPNAFRTPELLLAEHLREVPPGRVLCPEGNYGVVGTLLAGHADGVRTTESSARAARLCRHNARRNGAEVDVSVTADLSTLPGRFDVVAYAPKPYTPLAIGSQHVANALARLRPDGNVFLAVSKRTGLTRYEQVLAECCGNVERIAAEGGWHLLRAERLDHVDLPLYVTPRTLQPTVAGMDLELITVPGVFAASKLDDGTRLLIETVGRSLPEEGRILDLCCGYGSIGVYAASVTDAVVWLSDDCRFATRCAEGSLDRTDVEGTVVTADGLRGVSELTFDAVVCNPPTHTSDAILSTLLSGVADVLAQDGQFWFVHHRALDFREHVEPFGHVERLRTGREHVVFEATL